MTDINSNGMPVPKSHVRHTYNIDSDDDSDDDEEFVVNPPRAAGMGYLAQIKEMNKLKEQSNALLDGKWKDNRKKQLLSKMLELEEPTITVKMVEFLLQDGVTEVLVGFITDVALQPMSATFDDTYKDSVKNESLKLSFRTTMLLTPEEPSEALSAFLGKRSSLITRLLFQSFRDDFGGSYYHCYRILETLLRYYPGDVYEGLNYEGKTESRIQSLLRQIGQPAVADILVMLVSVSALSKYSPLYTLSTRSRWCFYDSLSHFGFVQRVVDNIVRPDCLCHLTRSVSAVDHAFAATQALQDIMDRVSADDAGELLFQPLGHSQEVYDSLCDCITDTTREYKIRCFAASFLTLLLKRSSDENLLTLGHPGQAPSSVPNRLHPFRSKMLKYVNIHNTKLQTALLGTVVSAESVIAGSEVRHPGHVVSSAFSWLRLLLLELVVLLCEADDGTSNGVLDKIPEEVWRQLLQWIKEYPHSNVFHSLFSRLLFVTVRSSYDEAVKVLLKNAKFINFLAENFEPFESLPVDSGRIDLTETGTGARESDSVEEEDADGRDRTGTLLSTDSSYMDLSSSSVGDVSEDLHRLSLCSSPGVDISQEKAPTTQDAAETQIRVMIRGLLMNCCNVLRLQMDASSPNSYLRMFLASHHLWQPLVTNVRTTTEFWQNAGLGIAVPEGGKSTGGLNNPGSTVTDGGLTGGIDHGSKYARLLGFDGDVSWPTLPVDLKKKLKARQKKKKSALKKRSAKASDTREEDSVICSEEDGEDDLEAGSDMGTVQPEDDVVDKFSV